MHDLRKKALLESGKTTSRKGRGSAKGSATPSPGNSRPTSRGNSRVGSRNPSDEEDELSDTTEWSTNSIDDLVISAAEIDLTEERWITELGDHINEICDRKRSSYEVREGALHFFNEIVAHHYAWEELKPKVGEVLPALMKSLKSGGRERETVLTLKAISLLLITVPSDGVYDTVSAQIKHAIQNSDNVATKVASIHCFSLIAMYDGASDEEVEEVLDFFLDIISSDGNSINEPDNAEVVVAALEAWGFLATHLDDMEETTEVAMETFADQLDSSDVGVQIAAGDNIALLYEKSYTEAESLDDTNGEDSDIKEGNERMVKRYTVYRQQYQLEHKLQELTRVSSKRLSKQHRKTLHLTFRDVLNTVEKPTRGPRYNTALDIEGREYGSRMKVTISNGDKMIINKWWKLHRYNALRRLLQGGLLVHLEQNDVISESLDVEIE